MGDRETRTQGACVAGGYGRDRGRRLAPGQLRPGSPWLISKGALRLVEHFVRSDAPPDDVRLGPRARPAVLERPAAVRRPLRFVDALGALDALHAYPRPEPSTGLEVVDELGGGAESPLLKGRQLVLVAPEGRELLMRRDRAASCARPESGAVRRRSRAAWTGLRQDRHLLLVPVPATLAPRTRLGSR